MRSDCGSVGVFLLALCFVDAHYVDPSVLEWVHQVLRSAKGVTVSSTSDPVTERTTGDQFPSDLRYFDDDDVEAARLAGRDINFLLLDGLPMLGTKRHALPPNQPSACIPTTAGSSLSASEPHEPAVTHTPSSIDRLEKIGNAERKTFIGLLSMLKTSKASTPPTKSASYCQ